MRPEEHYRTPGQYIDALLEERGWTNRILALIAGVDEGVVSKLVNGKKVVDAETALVLGEVFEVPAEHFLDLQKLYDLAMAKTRQRPDPGRSARAHLFGKLPVSDMIKRGWLEGVESVKNPKLAETALARFFGVTRADEIEVLPHAAKKTEVFGAASPTQLAWLYRVKRIAHEMPASHFSPSHLESAIRELGSLRISSVAIRHVPRILAGCGIRYVIVESLPRAKIDGACFWLDERPVVGMSLRHDRIDNFWFVLRHELEHARLGHGRVAVMLDSDLEGERAGTGESIAGEERAANAAAAEFCVPQKQLDAFVVRKNPFFADRDIVAFSRMLKVHPGLIAGQLQHRTGRYDRFREHQVKVRSVIIPNAMTDGWGDIAPLDYQGNVHGN